MNWKFFLIFIALIGVAFSIILLTGLYGKEKLKEEISSINNLDDVVIFLEKCGDKIFLDCELLLERELQKTEKENVK